MAMTVADGVARHVVAAAAHRYQQAVVSGEIDGGNHISCTGTAGNDRGSMLDHRVVDLARRIVTIGASKQMATAQSLTELLDHICVECDLATHRRCDFDIRHVGIPSPFRTFRVPGIGCGCARR
jgi:hypothetical protein